MHTTKQIIANTWYAREECGTKPKKIRSSKTYMHHMQCIHAMYALWLFTARNSAYMYYNKYLEFRAHTQQRYTQIAREERLGPLWCCVCQDCFIENHNFECAFWVCAPKFPHSKMTWCPLLLLGLLQITTSLKSRAR